MAAKRVYLPRESVACLIIATVFTSIRAQQQVLDETSCVSLSPRLSNAPQDNTNAPFLVQVSPQSYVAGSTITVTYLPRLSPFVNFQEIIVQARRTTGSTQAVGTFTLVNGQTVTSNGNYRFYNCGAQGSTLGTANANNKQFPLSLTYTAPSPAVGNIRFVATIVQQGQVYYQAFSSQEIFATGSDGNTPPNSPNCPTTSIRVTAVGGSQSAVATYGPFVCSDAQQGTIPAACSPVTGSQFNIGNNLVVCTCTDNGGLQSSCSFIVIVEGGTTRPGPPNCPDSAVTVTTVGGSASAVATYGPFTCSDAEQGSIIASCNPMSGTPFNIGGNNVVTCTCTDNGGLQSSCTFFVNVTRGNTQPGPPNCPFNGVTVFTVGGSARATYGPFVCSDAEQGSIITTCNPASGTTFSIGGNNVVTCTCTDNGGLQSSCTFLVNIMQENAPPGPPDCPNNGVTVVTVGGSTTAVATYGPFVCSDAEQGPITATCNPVSGTTFSIGNNVVACTCTDNGGRRSSCTFFVNIIRGNTPPGPPNCPNNGVTVVTVGGSTTAVATYGPFVCSDAEQGSITATCNPVSGSQFSIGGLNTVTCTCTDNGGLQSNCNFRVTVSCSDACSFNNRCVNGGTCRVYPGSCTQTFCDCPPCFTGADCQIAVSPCDVNRCQNGGFCVSNGQSCDSYTCLCTGCATGPFCNAVFNPCSRSPCLNGGVCTNIAETCASYSCACTGCFTGYNCQTPIPDPCLAAPCLNRGSCRRELGTCFGYTCQCLPGFEGVVCENNAVILRDPCASFPCQHYGWCIPLGGNDFKCLCRSQYTGIQCADMTANVVGSNSCLTNRCSNGGTCFNSYNSNSGSIIFAPQYTCVCAPGFAGQNCNLPTAFSTQLDTCTTAGVVCLNGGTCRNTFCSFSGDIGTYCECRIGFYGERCQIVDVNPCQSNPCRNDGQCTPFKNYFDCQCLATFSGPTCEVVGPRGSCIINPCRNGGTCFDGIAGFICLCTPFYTGVFCETFIQQEGCFFNPCLNGGTCLDGFRCLCPPSFTGPTCATFIPQPECPINPCLNGGTCLEGFRCLCLPFYTGPTCATFIPQACVSNPCLNGGTCLEFNNGFVCQCLPPFTGLTCAGNTCASRPCLNGGTCIDLTDAIGGFLCLCTSSFSGRNCEIRSSPCSSNPCVNGGTCSGSSNGFFCLCPPPFTGLTCQDGSSPCSSNPCVNGGTCSGSSNGFFCLCLPPFTGLTCQDGALVYNPGDSLVITSPEFPLAYPPGETQSVVVTSTVNLRVALTFFEVSSLEQLSIGRGSVIGQNRLEEYRNGLFGCTPNEDCVTPINGNTFWVQFVSNANIVADGQGYVLTVAQG